MGKHARILLGIAATAFFLWLAMRNVDLAAVGDALQAANYYFLIPAAACTVSGFCLRALRWSRLLRPSKPVGFQRLFPVMMVGFAANNLLPARIGEFVRAYLTGSREGISRSTALATIVVERVCDGLTLLTLMTAALLLFPIPMTDSTLQVVVIGASTVFGVAAVILIGLIVFPTRMLAPMRFGTRRLSERFAERADALFDAFLDGLRSLRDPRAIFDLAWMSAGIWMLECATFAFVLRAFPLGLSTGEWLAAAAFLLVFVNLGIMVPSVPGYVGTYQFFATLALGAFAVSSDYAFGLAVVAHAMQYLLITGIGLVCLWRLGLRIGGVARLAPEAKPRTSAPLRQAAD